MKKQKKLKKIKGTYSKLMDIVKQKEECPVDHSDSTKLTLVHQKDGTSYQKCEFCGWVNTSWFRPPKKVK